MRAQVAELVDALGSGPSGRKLVGVRVPSWAPLQHSSNSSSTLLCEKESQLTPVPAIDGTGRWGFFQHSAARSYRERLSDDADPFAAFQKSEIAIGKWAKTIKNASIKVN